MAIRKQIREEEDFAEIIQKIIKIHHKEDFKDLTFNQIICRAVGINDPYSVTNEQLLESLEDTYEK